MIKSFRHKGLKRLFDLDDRSKLPQDMVVRIGSILALLEQTRSLDVLSAPSLRLHPLKGEFAGFFAVTVRANWRIIFRFDGQHVSDVDFVDYH
jgi:toxin HigB-1